MNSFCKKTFFLFALVLIGVPAFSQNQSVVLSGKDITIQSAFEQIEKQTGLTFAYDAGTLDLKKIISGEIKANRLGEVLTQILKGTNSEYVINDKRIIVRPTKQAVTNRHGEQAYNSKDKVVTGIVSDENGEPLPGATVQIEGTTRGVLTATDGSFSIEVASGDKLLVSFVGMKPKTVTIGTSFNLGIQLESLANELADVTVVAYGSQRKESVIGAITGLSVNDIKMPAGKLSTALAGQLAGVVSVQSTGEPGESANFWIRGISTFGANNKPLILVDGIERDLDLVDPEDIESFSILKDATATAVYGVRGANGIVLITTKKGQESVRPSIKTKFEYGYMSPVKLPQLADASQWIDYFNDVTYDESGIIPYPDSEKEKFLTNADPDLYPNVNWMNTVMKKRTPNMKGNISITGGNNKFRYYISGNFYREEGMYNPVKNPDYNNSVSFNRFSFRSNIDVNITKSTLLTLNLANQYDTRNRLGENHSTIWQGILQTPAISLPLIYSDGNYARMKPANSINPYYSLNYTGFSRDTWFNSQSLIGITQDFSDIITKGLKANVKFSWDAINSNIVDQRKRPSTYFAIGRADDGTLLYEQTSEGSDYLSLNRSNRGSKTINFESSIIYENLFNERHRVSAMILFSMRQHSSDFPANFIDAIPNRNTGIAGRATYSYADKYFFEANFGYNGSENFAPKYRFGFFPSVAVGYMISNEKYFENLKHIVNLLKLKASYGLIGNDQIGGNRRFAFNTEMNNRAPGYTFGSIGQLSYTGIATGHPGNPNVAWEEAKKFNTGIEIGLYSALKIQADYFFDRRDGIYIQQESVPSVVGNNVQQYVNLGKMQNQGFDASLEFYKNFGDLFVSARGNFTFNRNKKLYDDKPTPIWPYQEEVNEPLYQNRGLVALGLFTSDEEIANSPSQTFSTPRVGDIKYKDINGDGVIDPYDVIAIGYSTIPEISYGFGASINWKGFDLSLFFQGVDHVTKFIGGLSIFGGGGNPLVTGQIFSEVADGRWSLKNPNPNAEFPRLSLSDNKNNKMRSSFWQRDMGFLRLKNAEIGYTLPKKLYSKAGISDLRIYIVGTNLLTFSKFKMWDPESGGTTGGSYPQMKSLNLGVNLHF